MDDLLTRLTTALADRYKVEREIGAVLFDGSHAVKGYGTLIDPGRPIPPDASAVNGITDEMVRGKPRVVDVLSGFADFCGDLPLVAHNAPFDFKFLLDDIKRHRAAAPAGTVLDTLPLARRISSTTVTRTRRTRTAATGSSPSATSAT